MANSSAELQVGNTVKQLTRDDGIPMLTMQSEGGTRATIEKAEALLEQVLDRRLGELADSLCDGAAAPLLLRLVRGSKNRHTRDRLKNQACAAHVTLERGERSELAEAGAKLM